MESQSPARYCECCGREVSQHQIENTHLVSERAASLDRTCHKAGGATEQGRHGIRQGSTGYGGFLVRGGAVSLAAGRFLR